MNTQRQMRRMKMMHHVAAEADRFYPRAEELGQLAADALTSRRRAQMTNLESIANSALRVSDVLDYIKIRTARSEKGKDWRKGRLGEKLLEFIGQTLKTEHHNRACLALDISQDSAEGQQVYLHLIRAFVHQLVAQYEYKAEGSR